MLGRLQFLQRINDLSSVVDPGTSVNLFVDNSLIYKIIDNIIDEVVPQQDLVQLELWTKSWEMASNPSKCYIMHILHEKNTLSHMNELCGTILGSIPSQKYLRVYIKRNLK